jgi:photosystem II stability/assembly factor-like uncharacterized protein
MGKWMKAGLELAGVGLALAVGLFAFGVIDVGTDKTRTGTAFAPASEEHEGLGPAEPDQWFIDQRAGGPGKALDMSDFTRAVDQSQSLRSSFQREAAPRQIRGTWQFAGPSNVGGRITDLVVDPSDPGTVYVAAASGGLWKSTDADRADGRLSFQKAWPDDFAQGMGAVAIGSDGRVWAGTGEPQPGGGSITFGGNGIFSSDDGGATWRKRGLENSGATGEIVVDPTNPRRVFVAAAGSLFNPGGDRGIYRSTNGGNSFRRVLAPETPFAGGVDIAIHPSNPNRIYAAMWDHRREPDVRTYGGQGSGLFRSDDGGDTWTRLSNVLTYSAGDSVNGVPLGLSRSLYLGRIGVAIAPSNPNRLYVITTKTNGADGGFYVSNDGGDSFNASGPDAANRPGSQGGFGWWFGRLWVDPANQNHVLVAGVDLRRSTDGGVTWNEDGFDELHADQHALQWDPHRPGRAYLGNDGGVYRSDGNGVQGSWRKAVNEPYTQFYSIDVGERFPDRITGGAQDNGSLRSWQAQGPGTTDNWNGYNGGDGEYTLIDPVDNDIFYGCSQYGNCARFNEGSAPLPARRTISSGTVSQRRNWLTPIAFDPNNSSVVYYGGNVLNRSVNRGDTWTQISPADPVSLPGTFEPGRNIPEINGPYPNWGTITAIDIAKTASDTIYVGTDTGRLWKTDNGGTSWTWFNSHGLPERWVTRVAIDPRDEATVYATFSGFRNGEDAANVYKTTNGGRTWKNISGNLPNAPINDVIVDVERETVYAGGDVGVFYLKNGKKNWKPVGGGLPLAPVLDMRLHQPSGTLFANTFGRSMFKLTLPSRVDD